jgi:hypothetical protein
MDVTKRLKRFGHIIKFVNISYNGYSPTTNYTSNVTSIDYNYTCLICDVDVVLINHPYLNKRRKNKHSYYYIPGDLTCNEALIKKLLE